MWRSAEERIATFFVASARLGLGEHVGWVRDAWKVAELDELLVDEFEQEVDACHVVANAVVVAGEVGAECDGTFVVDVEWRRVELWESEFGEHIAKEDDIYRSFCCGVGFTLC